MTEFSLHPLAQADLDTIVYYTTRNWGAEQARKYSHELQTAISEFSSGARSGKSISSKLPGLKLVRAEHHYLCVLQQVGKPLLIVAILHERMDFLPRIRNRLKEIEA